MCLRSLLLKGRRDRGSEGEREVKGVESEKEMETKGERMEGKGKRG